MSRDRRYQDHEVRQILDLAIGQDESPEMSFSAVDGLTLPELQEVGREVGLPPNRITQAVAVFEGRGDVVPRGTTLGLPTSIGRIVSLPRTPSDREWELLIAELRTTFGGKGEVTSQGGLREWSDGTLHALVEPTETDRGWLDRGLRNRATWLGPRTGEAYGAHCGTCRGNSQPACVRRLMGRWLAIQAGRQIKGNNAANTR